MPDRVSMIRLIHVARRDLALDDGAYQAIIQAQTGGKTSSADCSLEELDAVLAHMRRSGFRVRHAKTAKSRKIDTSAQAKKVRAIWLLLFQIGEVRDPSESALASYCKRIAKVDDLHWA
jgi:phage gp16-like protein